MWAIQLKLIVSPASISLNIHVLHLSFHILASDLRPKCSYHFLWCTNGFNCRIVSKSCERCLVRIVGLKQGKTLKQKEEATRTHHQVFERNLKQ